MQTFTDAHIHIMFTQLRTQTELLLTLTTFSPDLANSTAPCIEGNIHCGPNL